MKLLMMMMTFLGFLNTGFFIILKNILIEIKFFSVPK